MTEIPYHRIAAQFYNRPLLLAPAAAETISAFLMSRVGAGPRSAAMNDDSGSSVELFRPTQTEAGAEVHRGRASRFYGQTALDDSGRPQPFRRTQDGVGIITLVGEFVNRGAWVGASSGLVSYEGFKVQMAAAARDPNTRAIILDIESPGGEAVGAFEAAAAVRDAAKLKTVVAVPNGMAASAAYAIASGASRIVVPPTGLAGSIGVVMMHLDFSKYLQEEGIKPTLIFAGAHKVDGNPYEALPDSVRAEWQQEVDDFYQQFVSTVAAGRSGLTEQRIRATEARVLKGEAAVAAGLADSVGTFEEVLADLSRGSSGRAPTSTTMKGQRMNTTTGAPAADVAGNDKPTTSAELRAAFPDLVTSIETASATAERSRILGIAALADAGNAALVAEMQADGKTSPEAAALRILNAQKEAKGQRLQAIVDVEQTTAAVKPSATTQLAAVVPPAADADGWKAEWAGSKALQAEFDSADAYAAYQGGVASGRIKRLERNTA
ncbi:S49 family peptidase [Bradyrhizobium sp. PUT101]|uniref:S49 family peptidase n=1 Tax=Bradyrhizobium sp. PUT101 TaxID=3447427 RepID=UPI003F842A68